jgi:hypothetical protein
VIGVLLVLRELRESTRLTRAANAQHMVEMTSPFYLSLIQDRQMAELCTHSAASFDDLDEVDRRRYRSLLTWWLIFYENVYYQRRQDFMDNHAFLPWWRDLKLFVLEQNLARHWDELKELFQEEFAAEVSKLLAETPRPSSGSIGVSAGGKSLLRR